jgi:hypothetical protein
MKGIAILLISWIVFIESTTAATIQTEIQQYDVRLGQTFTVNVIGTDFPITQGGGFNISYDASILNINTVIIDETNTWTFYNNTGSIDNITGVLNEVIVSDFPGIDGDFIVASVEFLAVGVGNSDLYLSDSLTNPWASDGNVINNFLNNNSLVQVVPIPTSFILFGFGLLGLISLFKKYDFERGYHTDLPILDDH